MTILIASPRVIDDTETIIAAAEEQNWSICRPRYWRIDEQPDGENFVVYGEPLFAAAVAQQLSLILLEPQFDWLSSLPPHYLKREIRSSNLGSMLADWFPAFIKPAGDKCFPAQVYPSQNDFPELEYLAPTTPILISEPVNWEIEFRCFIRERQCKTFSIYARNGELAQAADGSWPTESHEKAKAESFINALLADPDVSLPPSVTIDVGRIEDRGWAVIEANPSWGSGIYGCDPYQVLDTIARGCRTIETLTDENIKWVVERPDVN
ncbi:MAG: ATP-grasp domain-containing protein [Anaerolineales bacterium]|nr:ATP-grasp domain-containing protein [Anaerolineales bacterium]